MSEDIVKNSFWSRLALFFTERYPLILGGLTTFTATLSIYLVWVALTPGTVFRFNNSFVLAFLNLYLLTIILRLCDELKDKDIDASLFPERCLPAGKVLYEDVQKLLALFVLIWLPANYILGKSPLIFSALVVYTWLFYKSFYFPRAIGNKIIWALVTHNPIMLVASFYTLSLFSVDQDVDMYSSKNLLMALSFWMPTIAWETSRKITSKEYETEYITYSKVLGTFVATLLPLGAILAQTVILVNVVESLQYAFYYKLGAILLYLFYVGYFLLFLITRKKAFSSTLRHITEAHIFFHSLVLLIIAGIEVFK